MLERIGNVIMPTRLKDSENAIVGMEKSNIYGIAYENNGYAYTGWSDDQGLYIFIQFVNKFFSLTVVESIGLFYLLVLSIGFLLYFISGFLLFKEKKTRLFFNVWLVLLTLLAFKIRDVYIMFYFTVSFIPIFIYFLKKEYSKKYLILFSLLLIVGVFMQISNYFRGYSGTLVILFICTYLLFSKINPKIKAISISILFAGLIFTKIFWNYSIENPRKIFIEQVGTDKPMSKSHPFWHTVYIGFGYIDNNIVEKYLDEVAFEKVKSINPNATCCTPEYEDILKNEVIQILIKHPLLFVSTVGAKIGVYLVYFILFINLGLYFFIKNIIKTSLRETVPFVVALLFSLIFGILAIPSLSYSLGFLSIIMVFVSYVMDNSFYKNHKNFKKV